LVRGFHENDVPLDVLVIDMGWHISDEQLKAAERSGSVRPANAWAGAGYTWDKLLFSSTRIDFLARMHNDGLKATLEPASGLGHSAHGSRHIPQMATAMGIDPRRDKYVLSTSPHKKFAHSIT